MCNAAVASFVNVFMDVVDATERDQEIRELQEAVCAKDSQLTQVEGDNRKKDLELQLKDAEIQSKNLELYDLKATILVKNKALEQVCSELNESNEKNRELEEEMDRGKVARLFLKNPVATILNSLSAVESDTVVDERTSGEEKETKADQHGFTPEVFSAGVFASLQLLKSEYDKPALLQKVRFELIGFGEKISISRRT